MNFYSFNRKIKNIKHGILLDLKGYKIPFKCSRRILQYDQIGFVERFWNIKQLYA